MSDRWAVLARGGDVGFARAAWQKTERNSEIVSNVVDAIAAIKQSLALKAGIEAVRAEEAGRDFGVIAQEAPGLAPRIADAGNEIKPLISPTATRVTPCIWLVKALTAGTEEPAVKRQKIVSSADHMGKVLTADPRQIATPD